MHIGWVLRSSDISDPASSSWSRGFHSPALQHMRGKKLVFWRAQGHISPGQTLSHAMLREPDVSRCALQSLSTKSVCPPYMHSPTVIWMAPTSEEILAWSGRTRAHMLRQRLPSSSAVFCSSLASFCRKKQLHCKRPLHCPCSELPPRASSEMPGSPLQNIQDTYPDGNLSALLEVGMSVDPLRSSM